MTHIQLPMDVIIDILSVLPPSRDREESSVKVLVNCSTVSKLWNEAASQSLLWKPHYHARYLHCFEERELVRKSLCNNDYRDMYAYRRRLDNRALDRLNDIVASAKDRTNIASTLADDGMDLFDVLELEASRHLPSPFLSQAEAEAHEGGKLPKHAAAYRYWAQAMLETVARCNCISSVWRRFKATSESQQPSFEETMTSMSAFFGASVKLIRQQLEDLWAECRQDFIRKGIDFDTSQPTCDLRNLSKQICIFMRNKGFRPVPHPRLLPPGETDILNKLPHAYLTTEKISIPISLCHVFAAIATRFNVDTRPVNFPGIVLMHVTVPAQGQGLLEDTFLVNPFSRDPNYSVIGPETPLQFNPVLQMGAVLQNMNLPSEQYLKPCMSRTMLIRACANIAASFESLKGYGRPEVRPAGTLATYVHILFGENPAHINSLLSVAALRPIDTVPMLKQLSPLLPAGYENVMRSICKSTAEQDAQISRVRRRRYEHPLHFVGMAFTHRRLRYKGFIYDWDETCTASEAWIQSMQIDNMSRGRYQPFYRIYGLDGSQRYVAEENIEPTSVTTADLEVLEREFTDLPLRFEGVQFGKERARLLLSVDSKRAYPEDDEAGDDWVNMRGETDD